MTAPSRSALGPAKLAWRWQTIAPGRAVPRFRGCSADWRQAVALAGSDLRRDDDARCVRVEQVIVDFMAHVPTGNEFTGLKDDGPHVWWTTAAGEGHEPALVEGSAYRAGPGNGSGLANLRNSNHFPVTGVCGKCSQVLSRAAIGEPWAHTGRLAGQAPAAVALPGATTVGLPVAGTCPRGGDHEPKKNDCQPPDNHCSKCGQYLGPA